jgi:hypothetical protein
MRIGLAIIILVDLFIRSGDIFAHYGNEGVLPANIFRNFGWKPGYWSIHDLSKATLWPIFLFSIQGIFALFLLVGYRSKVSAFIVWLLYISLHNRNLYIQQAGDDLIRLLLFWGIFLPWSTCYSIEKKGSDARTSTNDLAGLGYFLLIASVYFFTASLKTSAEWHSDYSAIYYALSLDQLRLPIIGDWLYQHPPLMSALTAFVYYSEWLLPFLILVPAKKGQLKLLAFVLIVILHAGIGFTLYVGLFWIINIVGAIALLPAKVMDKLERKITSSAKTCVVQIKEVNSDFLKKILGVLPAAICTLAIFLSLLVNLSSLNWFRYELRNEMLAPVNIFRFDQYWGMFSPSVLKRDGWYVYHAMDSLGQSWDLQNRSAQINFSKPSSVFAIHRTDRWRKLTENLQRDNSTFLRPLFCRYVLREWNKKHPDKQMYTLFLYYMQTETLADYKKEPTQKILFSTCNDR